MFDSKQELLDALSMPYETFSQELMPLARAARKEAMGDVVTGVAMLGYDNICRCQCLYCGMRAGNPGLKRYRLSPEQILEAAQAARELGFGRLFLISGEDPKYGFDNLLAAVSGAAALGLSVSLACGEFEPQQYRDLRQAGADEYVLKFEMSHPDTFDRLNPSTTFRRRMDCIRAIQEAGFRLGTGNLIDYPGHTLDELADDLLLTRELGASWAPVIPYLPALGTPLAAQGGPGRITLALREITLLRLMMPGLDITAQQPGPDLSQGLSSPQGNLDALNAGGNRLFADLLPDALAGSFRVVDNRCVKGVAHMRAMAEQAGMTLSLG